MYEYRKMSSQQQSEVVQKRLSKGFPAHSPPHPILDCECYHLTITCFEHKERINTEQRRHQLLDLLFQKFTNIGMEINAWVILPNHYHLLVHHAKICQLKDLFRSIHGRLARQWNLEDNLTGKVWHSYSDRAIRSDRHYYATLNYIHYNPVKHNYVESVYNWSASSVHWYLEHKGREWLRNCWVEYPIKDYGKNWDD